MGTALVLLVVMGVVWLVKQVLFEQARIQRRSYYRDDYLKSDAWKRKRYVVLKRDHWRCVYCGGRATQVHHTRYAKRQVGREPIKWLVSVCKDCHDAQHASRLNQPACRNS
jgi:5-methylcytosine-specific restriction endonuclease McrA